jgi:hypothetical protein
MSDYTNEVALVTKDLLESYIESQPLRVVVMMYLSEDESDIYRWSRLQADNLYTSNNSGVVSRINGSKYYLACVGNCQRYCNCCSYDSRLIKTVESILPMTTHFSVIDKDELANRSILPSLDIIQYAVNNHPLNNGSVEFTTNVINNTMQYYINLIGESRPDVMQMYKSLLSMFDEEKL